MNQDSTQNTQQESTLGFLERSRKCIAQGCVTYSKRITSFIEGVHPSHIDGGDGCCLYVDGKGYVDMVCGLGSNLLSCSNNYTLPTRTEVIVAERIKERVPCIDKLKFLKTGSEACHAAVRIARAYTGRGLVLGTGYHGWTNTFICSESPGVGTVFEMYHKFDSLDELQGFFEAVIALDDPARLPAAVIVEPVQLDTTPPVWESLVKLRELCSANGVVLIFDEVITGFRVPMYTVSEWFGIRPDLICLGKAIANGYPLSIVGGKAEIMDTEGYFVSSTFAGELCALEEAEYVLDCVTKEKLDELWRIGGKFKADFNQLSPKIQLVGYNTRGEWHGNKEYVDLFWQEMFNRGFICGKAWFLSFSHTDEILSAFISAAKAAISEIDSGKVKLEGIESRPVFRRN